MTGYGFIDFKDLLNLDHAQRSPMPLFPFLADSGVPSHACMQLDSKTSSELHGVL